VIGGHRASQAILKPTVGHFMEMAVRHDVDFVIEEILVESGSFLCDKLLKDSRLHEDHAIVVLTIKSVVGEMIFNPQGETKLEAGHVLVVVGHRGHMKQVKRLGRAAE